MGKIKRIDYQGEQLTITRIAQMNDINREPLRRKYNKTGDIDQAVLLAQESKMGPRGPIKYVDLFGEKMAIGRIAKIYGMKYETLLFAYQVTSDIDEAISLCFDARNIVGNYKLQKNAVSLNKLRNLKVPFQEIDLKIEDHTFLKNIDQIAKVDNEILKEKMKVWLKASLSPREQKVLRLYYGLDDGCCQTQMAIAKIFGVSSEWIRQIIRHAIFKLRKPSPYLKELHETILER